MEKVIYRAFFLLVFFIASAKVLAISSAYNCESGTSIDSTIQLSEKVLLHVQTYNTFLESGKGKRSVEPPHSGYIRFDGFKHRAEGNYSIEASIGMLSGEQNGSIITYMYSEGSDPVQRTLKCYRASIPKEPRIYVQKKNDPASFNYIATDILGFPHLNGDLASHPDISELMSLTDSGGNPVACSEKVSNSSSVLRLLWVLIEAVALPDQIFPEIDYHQSEYLDKYGSVFLSFSITYLTNGNESKRKFYYYVPSCGFISKIFPPGWPQKN